MNDAVIPDDGSVDGTADQKLTRRSAIRIGAAGALGLGAIGAVGAPGGAASDAVVLHRDFEDLTTGDWSIDESQWNGLNPWSVDTTYVDVVSMDGDTVLDTQYPAGQAGNGNGGVDLMVPLGGHYDELYHGYRVRFGDGFEFSNAGGKLPGLIGTANGTYAVTGGDDPDGTNGWSARMMWRDPAEANLDEGGLVMFYVYHPDQPGEYGENMYWDDGPSGQVYFERGTWHEVEHRIVMNTPGENDGILEGWFDGEKAFERRNLRFWDVDGVGINKFYVSAFFGGDNTSKWAHSREEHVYYDDFWISEAPIWNGAASTVTPTDGSRTETPTDGSRTETPTDGSSTGPDAPIDGTVPTDVDGDGLYMDVNGNGRLDSDDVVTYFEHMDSAAITDDPGYYDYNGNSRIDFDDLVTLFESL